MSADNLTAADIGCATDNSDFCRAARWSDAKAAEERYLQSARDLMQHKADQPADAAASAQAATDQRALESLYKHLGRDAHGHQIPHSPAPDPALAPDPAPPSLDQIYQSLGWIKDKKGEWHDPTWILGSDGEWHPKDWHPDPYAWVPAYALVSLAIGAVAALVVFVLTWRAYARRNGLLGSIFGTIPAGVAASIAFAVTSAAWPLMLIAAPFVGFAWLGRHHQRREEALYGRMRGVTGC